MDAEVVQLVKQLKQFSFISVQGLYYMVNPKYEAMLKQDFDDPDARLAFFRKFAADMEYNMSIHKNISDFRENPVSTTQLMTRFSLASGIGLVHDLLVRKGLLDATPELQFLRHLRNAVSHGNRFHLSTGEPKRLAKFKEFEITPELNGMENVLFEYIYPGDVIDLLDFVAAKE